MRFRVLHRTTYAYDTEVSVSHHVVRITPRQSPAQQCLQHTLHVHPAPALRTEHADYFGNAVVFLTVEAPHAELTLTADSDVRVAPPSLPPPAASPAWESIVAQCEAAGPDVLDAQPFRYPSRQVALGPRYADYARPAFTPNRPILEALDALLRQFQTDFTFDPQATTVATPVATVLQQRRGVCQDFAHLALACLRSLGLPARYVSGYLETLPPPGQPKLVGADASHAWVALFCPGLGWIDLDPTNHLFPAEQHITAAWGRDYADVSPVRGVLVGAGRHRLSVAVDVQRLALG